MSPSPHLLAAALALAGAAAAPVATLLWTQNEPDATYTSAAISLHGAAAPPTFATATSGLSTWPVMLEIYNVSDSGENVWSYAAVSTAGLMPAEPQEPTPSPPCR